MLSTRVRTRPILRRRARYRHPQPVALQVVDRPLAAPPTGSSSVIGRAGRRFGRGYPGGSTAGGFDGVETSPSTSSSSAACVWRVEQGELHAFHKVRLWWWTHALPPHPDQSAPRRRGGATTRGVWSTGARAPRALGGSTIVTTCRSPPGRSPGEPAANRRPGKAPASLPRRRAPPRCARYVRRCSNATAKHGRHGRRGQCSCGATRRARSPRSQGTSSSARPLPPRAPLLEDDRPAGTSSCAHLICREIASVPSEQTEIGGARSGCQMPSWILTCRIQRWI